MRFLFKIFKVVIIIYILICALLYIFQEKLIFFPQKLSKSFKFNFENKFEELDIKTKDNIRLNGILFHADSAKGLIFYLHGNAGSLNTWGTVAKTYTDLNYDVFMPDYRGYGKSEGSIKSEQQLYEDIQVAYDNLKTRYDENRIVVLGYSIGTGPATNLASENEPKMLILQAPYFSLTDLMKHTYRVIPTFILKYKFDISENLPKCKMPVIIFHGNQDEVIYYGSSQKLKEEFKANDTLIILNGQGHNGMTNNPEYQYYIKEILNRK